MTILVSKKKYDILASDENLFLNDNINQLNNLAKDDDIALYRVIEIYKKYGFNNNIYNPLVVIELFGKKGKNIYELLELYHDEIFLKNTRHEIISKLSMFRKCVQNNNTVGLNFLIERLYSLNDHDIKEILEESVEYNSVECTKILLDTFKKEITGNKKLYKKNKTLQVIIESFYL